MQAIIATQPQGTQSSRVIRREHFARQLAASLFPNADLATATINSQLGTCKEDRSKGAYTLSDQTPKGFSCVSLPDGRKLELYDSDLDKFRYRIEIRGFPSNDETVLISTEELQAIKRD